MADADETKKQEDSEVEKENVKTSGGGILRWIIMAVVVVVCAGAGFGLGRLFGGTGTPETAEPSQQDQPTQPEDPEEKNSTTDSQKGWYYELEPIVACLDEPGVTRYARLALTLRISADLSVKQGTALLEEKKPVLINWVSIYLAGLKLDDIRGERNQKRIQFQILDAFNERLFPDAKPQIRKILFKEFVVQ
jgi:flagellar basal body-associated protein FliL